MIRAAATLALLGVLAGPALAQSRFVPSERDGAVPCPEHGAGFVRLPGTSTCLRVGGRVRAEYGTTTRRISRDQIAGFGSSGTVSADTRTDTGAGPVRTFVRMRAVNGGR